MKRIRSLLIISLLAVCSGSVVALGTAALIGISAKHLPGGSLSAGLIMGIYFPYKDGVPRWMCSIAGGIAGLIGWAISMLFF